MKPKTEELLYLLLWSTEKLLQPRFRIFYDGSFEGWAYRNGFLRELAALEKKRFVERRSGNQRVYRLTAAGRQHALCGRDPHAEWSRNWDGRWRLICFDVPTSENGERLKLRRYLRSRRFGHLQNSVWVTPHPMDKEFALLKSAKRNVKSLILLEANACGGESDAEIVTGAWDFEEVNRLYSKHSKILDQRPGFSKRTNPVALRAWAHAERLAWKAAVTADPLLPRQLLPHGYLGVRAWQRRSKVLAYAGRYVAEVRFEGRFRAERIPIE